MNYKRYLVEFDTGVDLHGRDYTKAAKKAVKNAISHCCLCGLHDLLHLENPADAMKVHIRIGCPEPDAIKKEEILAQIPFGQPEIEIVPGGLTGRGLCVPSLGEGDTIVMVNALLTVWIDMDKAIL
ncbi:MAG: Lin0512 family protein [Eubacterium sp.]|nr:Lin0512 family protein [Eubacterium sp.]